MKIDSYMSNYLSIQWQFINLKRHIAFEAVLMECSILFADF